jgi:hypothetical protein
MLGYISVFLAAILQPVLFIVFLRLGVKWVCKFKLTWGKTFAIGLPALGLFAIAAAFAKQQPIALLAAAVIIITLYGLFIRSPEQQPIKYLRAFLVLLIQLVLTLLIVALVISVPFIIGASDAVMNMEQHGGTVVEFGSSLN